MQQMNGNTDRMFISSIVEHLTQVFQRAAVFVNEHKLYVEYDQFGAVSIDEREGGIDRFDHTQR